MTLLARFENASDDDILEHFRTTLLTRPDATTLLENLDAASSLMDSLTNRATAARLAAIVAACQARRGNTEIAHTVINLHIDEHDSSTPQHRELLYMRAVVLMMENRVSESIAILEQLLASSSPSESDDLLRSRILNVLGGLYGDQGRTEDAMRIHEENIILRERLADPVALAVAYYNYGEAWKRLDDHETAYEYLRRAYVIERAYGQTLQAVSSAGSLAVIAAKRGDTSEALTLAAEGVDLAMTTGIEHQIVSALLFQSETYSILGRPAEAKEVLLDALKRTNDCKLDDLRFHALVSLAELAREESNSKQAAEALAEAATLHTDESNDYLDQRLAITNIHLCYDERDFDRLWSLAESLLPRLAETQNVPAMLEIVALLVQSLDSINAAVTRQATLQQMIEVIRRADERRTRRRLTTANIRFRSERRQHELEVERLRNVKLAQAMERLRSAHEDQQRMMMEQSDILRLIAHDLREPLASIRDVLAQSEDTWTERNREHTRSMIDHALQSVNALLSSQHRISPSTDLVNITYLARTAVDRHRSAAERRSHIVQVQFDEQIWCNTDVALVSSILDNLIGNAIKHTPPSGFITVSTQALGNRITIAVSDTGPGIPESVRNRLFTEYGNSPSPSQSTSLGLGLYLSKRLAERLGGTIEYSVGPHGIGSTFSLVLSDSRSRFAS
jgi:signal transduction histidine kinase